MLVPATLNAGAVADRASDLQLAVAAAKHANEALDLERARAVSAASDLDGARYQGRRVAEVAAKLAA